MRYATFSREIGLTLYKTCYFSTILQQNLIFFLLTWLGIPIFLILFISTQNELSMIGF